MGLADPTSQTSFILRNGNQVDMIWHQTVTPNLDLVFPAPFRHQIEISKIILRIEKYLLPTIAALGDLMWVAGGNYACDSVRTLP